MSKTRIVINLLLICWLGLLVLAILELLTITKLIGEISSNNSLVIELTVGLVITIIVYWMSKKWQNETQITMNETRNFAKSLAEITLKNEIRSTQTNIKHLNLLQECNTGLATICDDCMRGITESNLQKELKGIYKTCIHLWKMYDGPEDSIMTLTNAVKKIKADSILLDYNELFEDLNNVIDEQRIKISHCMGMEVKDLDELKKSRQTT